MAQFASATFTGTAFQELSAADANWSKQSGWTGDLIIGAGGTYVIRNAQSPAGVYKHTGSPASADYTVAADIAVLNANAAIPQAGVCGRMQSAAQTLYAAIWGESTGNIRLFKWVAGTQTQIGSSYTYTLTTTPARLELVMNGSSISVKLDGATIIGPVTDASITTAGNAGIYLSDNRVLGGNDATSLTNFSADDLASPSDLSGAATLAAITASGSLSTGASTLTGAATLSTIAASGTLSVNPAQVLVDELRNWAGTLQAGVTIPVVTVCRLDTGAQVLTLTNQATNGSGDLTISSGSLAAGTWYMVVGWNADGSARFAVPLQAA